MLKQDNTSLELVFEPLHVAYYIYCNNFTIAYLQINIISIIIIIILILLHQQYE
jgi:hypothetical protein